MSFACLTFIYRIAEAILLCKDIELINLPHDPVIGQLESELSDEEHSDGYSDNSCQ